METQFTPGPWSIPTNVKTLVVTVGYPSRSICTTGNWEDNRKPFETDRENEANAKLIAAAPELLEALKNMLQFPIDDLNAWANGKEPITITYVPQHIKDALSAINKAVGE